MQSCREGFLKEIADQSMHLLGLDFGVRCRPEVGCIMTHVGWSVRPLLGGFTPKGLARKQEVYGEGAWSLLDQTWVVVSGIYNMIVI